MSDATCSVDGCETRAKFRGWCRKHYARWQRTGDPTLTLTEIKAANRPVTCTIEGCDRPLHAHQWCLKHYSRWRRTGEATRAGLVRNPPGHRVKCSVEGCDRDAECRLMCAGHYGRWRQTGDAGDAQFKIRRHTEQCAVDGCENLRVARDWCNTHYERWRVTGAPIPSGPKSASQSPNWRGADITYRTAHTRVVAAKGKASQYRCCKCEHRAQEWAYDHADPCELMSAKGQVYSADVDHYYPMCRSCHQSLDRAIARFGRVQHAEVWQAMTQTRTVC